MASTSWFENCNQFKSHHDTLPLLHVFFTLKANHESILYVCTLNMFLDCMNRISIFLTISMHFAWLKFQLNLSHFYWCRSWQGWSVLCALLIFILENNVSSLNSMYSKICPSSNFRNFQWCRPGMILVGFKGQVSYSEVVIQLGLVPFMDVEPLPHL